MKTTLGGEKQAGMMAGNKYHFLDQKYKFAREKPLLPISSTSTQFSESRSTAMLKAMHCVDLNDDKFKYQVMFPFFMALVDLLPGLNVEDLSFDEKHHIWSGQHEGIIADSAAGFARTLVTDSAARIPNPETTTLIDLAAGREPQGYRFAHRVGVKGYVGVEPNHAAILRNRILGDAGRLGSDIPFEVVDEDMLSFLRRIPKQSVGILCSGYMLCFASSTDYIHQTEQEIRRVVKSPDHFIGHMSCINPFHSRTHTT